MKRFFLLLFVMLSMNFARSQNWSNISPGTINNLNSVCFVSTDTGYVAGDRITLLKTVDGGVHWIPLNVEGFLPDTFSLKSLFFRNATTGWLVGQGGTILKTTDGGVTWSLPATQMPYVSFLNSVSFPTADIGYVAGGSHIDRSGWIDKSEDSGFLWLAGEEVGTQCLNSLFFIDATHGFMVGDSGTIIKTDDGAVTLNYILSGTVKNLNSVSFTDLNNGIVTGDGGLILRTTNGGSDWTVIPSGSPDDLLSVYFHDAQSGFICGEQGTILNTSDGGNTWTNLWSGTTERLHSICFPESETGYAVGDSGIILKTINGGGVGITQNIPDSWKIRALPNPVTDKVIVELSEVDQDAGIVLENSKGEILYKTTVRTLRFQIDMSGFPPSVYFLRYTDIKSEYHLKIIKR
jgi:photosystem II stability/assembly factor-like uncharacterized protein